MKFLNHALLVTAALTVLPCMGMGADQEQTLKEALGRSVTTARKQQEAIKRDMNSQLFCNSHSPIVETLCSTIDSGVNTEERAKHIKQIITIAEAHAAFVKQVKNLYPNGDLAGKIHSAFIHAHNDGVHGKTIEEGNKQLVEYFKLYGHYGDIADGAITTLQGLKGLDTVKVKKEEKKKE